MLMAARSTGHESNGSTHTTETHTMATTITLPNGVRIDTTDDGASLREAFATIGIFDATPQQIAAVAPQAPKAPKTPKAPKVPTQPKAERRPKAARGNGKALWASITSAVAEGHYDEARKLASVKPTTFGVQAEAAIARHQARLSKAEQRTVEPKAPKAQPKAQSSLPPKGEQVEVKVNLSEATQARLAKANSAEAQAPKEPEPKAPKAQPKAEPKARKRNHKPDCKCPTCPSGIKARKAPKVPQAPKAAPKAVPQPKAEKPSVVEVERTEPKAPAREAADEAAEQREADRIVAKGVEQADAMLKALDVDALREAIRNYNLLAKRNLRLGNERLAIAYDDALDSCSLALTMATESLATIG